VGSAPDHRESQPKLRSAREIGSISEASLNLEFRSAPGRADWILAPVAPKLGDAPFSNFPNLLDALAAFAHMIFEKSADSYDAVRIALGVAAVRPTANRRESYDDLTNLLPDVKVPNEGASELFFQINRPRASTSAQGYEINRMSRWMSIAIGQSFFPQTAQSLALLEVSGVTAYATRVELDISTPAERKATIPLADRRLLLIEMLDLAKELLDVGDRP
jgi:hypothetical protein